MNTTKEDSYEARMATERAERAVKTEAAFAWWKSVVALLGAGWHAAQKRDSDTGEVWEHGMSATHTSGAELWAHRDAYRGKVTVTGNWPRPEGTDFRTYQPYDLAPYRSTHTVGTNPKTTASLIGKWLTAYMLEYGNQLNRVAADATEDAAAIVVANDLCKATGGRVCGKPKRNSPIDLVLPGDMVYKCSVHPNKVTTVRMELHDLSPEQAKAILAMLGK